MRKTLLLATFLGLCRPCFANESSVIRSPVIMGPDDVVRFDLSGGLANPAPGISGDGSILWTKYPVMALGFQLGSSRHELFSQNAKFTEEHFDFVVEQSWPFFAGYHAVRARGGVGLARAHRAMDRNAAAASHDDASRIYWGAHISAAINFDIPLADLVWARVGCSMQKVLLERTPTQTALIGGVVWGGQWFGVGD